LSEDYPVNLVLLKGLKEADVEIVECREELWQGFLHQAMGRGVGGLIRLGARAVRQYLKLVWRYWHAEVHGVVLIGYPGYIDIVIARLLNLFSKRLLVLVSFISLYDTAVLDRGQIAAGTLRARLLYAVDRLAFRCADCVLVDTEQLAVYYAELFRLPIAKFHKSWVGNVFDEFAPAVVGGQRAGALRVLFFGTYVPLHGVEHIVEAAECLRHEEVEFTLIGSGQLYGEVRSRAEQSGLKRVHFADEWFNTEDLAEAMRRADICLGIFGATPKAARVIPYKAFGALALRRPLITRDSPAIRELLVDGESALLCPAGDGQALAEAIDRLRLDAALAARLAEAGYERYCQRASAGAIGRDLLHKLESCGVST